MTVFLEGVTRQLPLEETYFLKAYQCLFAALRLAAPLRNRWSARRLLAV